jgi:monothiol glutaredoxin
MSVLEKIQETIDNNSVVLYMKGSKDMPQCGFSATVSQILNQLGADF